MKSFFILIILVLVSVSCSKSENVKKDTINNFSIESNVYRYQYDSMIVSLNNAELTALYSKKRTVAQNLIQEKKYLEAIDTLLLIGEISKMQGRYDIASWQFNNAAKTAYDYFIALPQYIEYQTSLTTNKNAVLKFSELKSSDVSLLKHALLWLELASDFDDDAELKEPNRTSIINKNQRAITTILESIK